MYQAGVPLRHMRICEPFGPEQRQGLWLYHVIEPDRWAAMCARVSGVKSGGIYAGHDNHFYGHRKILKPEHLDWQEYALLLLNSMPEKQLSITAIKSPFICTGIRKRHRSSTNPARGHWRERYPPGGEYAKFYSITITGAGHYHLVLRKRRTISVITNG